MAVKKSNNTKTALKARLEQSGWAMITLLSTVATAASATLQDAGVSSPISEIVTAGSALTAVVSFAHLLSLKRDSKKNDASFNWKD